MNSSLLTLLFEIAVLKVGVGPELIWLGVRMV